MSVTRPRQDPYDFVTGFVIIIIINLIRSVRDGSPSSSDVFCLFFYTFVL